MDTIELLETIGQDASLRHASIERLSQTLEQMDASEGLKRAAATNDRDFLKLEFGNRNFQLASLVSQLVPDDSDEDKNDSDNDGIDDDE